MTTTSLRRITYAVRDLDRDLFQVVAAGEPPAGAVDELEAASGLRLPSDYREFLQSSISGLYVAARDEAWPSPAVGSVGPAWRAQWGFMTFVVGGQAPRRFDLHAHLGEAQAAGITDFIPIMKREGDWTVYGYEPDGLIVSYIEGERSVETIQDFADLVVREITELQERQRNLAGLLEADSSLRKEWFSGPGDEQP